MCHHLNFTTNSMARTVRRLLNCESSDSTSTTKKSGRNSSRDISPIHEEPTYDTTTFSDIDSVLIDDSGYLGGESGNVDSTVLGCKHSSSKTSVSTNSLKYKVHSRSRRCNSRTDTFIPDDSSDLFSLTETLVEDGESGGEEGDVTTNDVDATYVVKPKEEDIEENNPLSAPLAESTRIGGNSYASSRSSIGDLSCRSLYVIEEVDEVTTKSSERRSKKSNGSWKSALGSSNSATFNDTGVTDTEVTVSENSCKQRNSRKEDPGFLSQDINIAKEVLFERIKEVYEATKMEEKEKGRPLTELEMEEFQLKIKKVAESYCIDFLKLEL
uniref:VASP_tetra domain-containing protein n=1 Tax=Strongyloides papillosus TaxID=174720 RepID=A0A0N5BY29_STREA